MLTESSRLVVLFKTSWDIGAKQSDLVEQCLEVFNHVLTKSVLFGWHIFYLRL